MLVAVSLASGCNVFRDADPVSLTISSDKAALTQTESASLTVTLTNRTSSVIKADAPNSWLCAGPLSATDPLERHVTIPAPYCLAIFVYYQPIDVAPGATVTYQASWNPASSTVNGAPLAPGLYHLMGRVSADGKSRLTPPLTLELKN